jgi:TolA-binding protein
MGECYYARGLWMKSLETFPQVIQSYPLGNKAPDSMLKAGLCHLKLRNHRQGREVLEQVVQFYPSNPVARIARERLEQSQ